MSNPRLLLITFWAIIHSILGVTDLLEKPLISTPRGSRMFLEGEDFSIRCTTRSMYAGAIFYLKKSGDDFEVSQQAPALSLGVTFLITNASVGQSGEYQCQYRLLRDAVRHNSPVAILKITIVDQPSKPSIHLEPAKSHFEAYRSITCSLQSHFRYIIFILYKDGRRKYVRPWLEERRHSSAVFKITNTDRVNTGNFSCRYEILAFGRTYISAESNLVEVVIEDAKVRLTGGPDQCSGTVEVFYHGQWGSVVNADWNLPTVDVLCRHLRCGFAGSWQHSGVGDGKVWLTAAICQGDERSLWDCYLTPPHHRDYWNTRQKAVVKCSPWPFQPTIFIQRSPTIFVYGETLTIDCLAPRFYYDIFFYLENLGGNLVRCFERGFRTSFVLNHVNSSDAGSYRCWYQLKRDGLLYNSTASENINVTVGDTLARPMIKQDFPQRIFLAGDSTIIKCVTPYLTFVKGFYLYQKGQEKALQRSSHGGIAMSFLVPLRLGKGWFNFTCIYQVLVENRIFNSTPSIELQVKVIERLSAPRLEFVSSSSTFEVNKMLSCMVMDNFTGGIFSLHKDGQEKPVDQLWDRKRSRHVNFAVSKADRTIQGCYRCRYQINVGGYIYNSSLSNPLNITITDEIQLRLAGRSGCSGKVEVFYGGLWRKICNPRWSSRERNVVCGQVGCGFVASVAPELDSQRGRGQVLLDTVSCAGSESTLWQCSVVASIHRRNCDHLREAAVDYMAHPERPAIVPGRLSGRYLPGENFRIQCRAPDSFRGMQFNPSKCETMRVTRKRNPGKTSHNILGATLEESKQTKYLGIKLQNDLRWNGQTHHNNYNYSTETGLLGPSSPCRPFVFP